jgi:endonuclease/exonuclease/phosphatase family metal-dependent hydrolase
VKLLSYNILDGGSGRVELLAKVIERQQPDVVGLVEAEDDSVVEQFAGRMDMDYVHAPGNKKASALLTRLPIARTINHALLHPELEKSLLEATIVRPDGRELTVGVVHLHAGPYEADEQVRERELDVVLRIFAPHRAGKVPHLLCGDFNANAQHQRIDPAKCKPKTRAAWEVQGDLPRRVVQRLLDAGYVDTLYAYDREAGETGVTFTTKHPGQRVDYFFSHGVDVSQMRRAWIVNDAPAKDASDHFPVGLELAV